MMSKSDSERHSEYHGMYWKVQCSGIGPITRINDVPGEPRGARLTPGSGSTPLKLRGRSAEASTQACACYREVRNLHPFLYINSMVIRTIRL
jgi:hypothetical protein